MIKPGELWKATTALPIWYVDRTRSKRLPPKTAEEITRRIMLGGQQGHFDSHLAPNAIFFPWKVEKFLEVPSKWNGRHPRPEPINLVFFLLGSRQFFTFIYESMNPSGLNPLYSGVQKVSV